MGNNLNCVCLKKAEGRPQITAADRHNESKLKDEIKQDTAKKEKAEEGEKINIRTSIKLDRPDNYNEKDLRKFECDLAFDNIRIGAFYDIIKRVEEKDAQGDPLGYFMFENLVEETRRHNNLTMEDALTKVTNTSRMFAS